MAGEGNDDETAAPVRSDALAPSVERCVEVLLFLQSCGGWVDQIEIYRAVPGYQARDNDAAKRKQFDRDRDYFERAGVLLEWRLDPDRQEVRQWRLVSAAASDSGRVSLDGFSPNEIAALGTSLAMLNVESFGSALSGIAEAGAASDVNEESLTLHQSMPATVGLLAEAVADSVRLGFVYRAKHRVIEPYSVVLRNGRWYVRAVDTDAGELKTFRADRIENPGSIEHFARFVRDRAVAEMATQDFTLDPSRFGVDDPVSAAININDDLADDFATTFLVERVGQKDGETQLTVEVSNYRAFAAMLVPFVSGVRVNGPAELQIAMIQQLDRASDRVADALCGRGSP